MDRALAGRTEKGLISQRNQAFFLFQGQKNCPFDFWGKNRKTRGLADKTINSYEGQFIGISRFPDLTQDISALQKSDLNRMIAGMRDYGLVPNTIASYVRILKSFLSWCNEEGIT